MPANDPLNILQSLSGMVAQGHFGVGDLATALRRAGLRGSGLQGIIDMVSEITQGTSTLEDMAAIVGPKEQALLQGKPLMAALESLLTEKGLMEKPFVMSPEGAASGKMGEGQGIALSSAESPDSVLDELSAREAETNPAAAAELAQEAAEGVKAGKLSKKKLLQDLKKEVGGDAPVKGGKQMKAMPAIFSHLAKKLGLSIGSEGAMNPAKRTNEFIAELMTKVEELPKGKARQALQGRLYEAATLARELETGGSLSDEAYRHLQGVGRDVAEAFDKHAAKLKKQSERTPTSTRIPIKGQERMQTILKKLQARKSRGDPRAVSQLGKLADVPNLPKSAKVFGDKLPGVASVADEAVSSLPLGQQILAKGKKFLGNKSLLSGKNIGIGVGSLIGGSLISKLLESKFPSRDVELANLALDEGIGGPRSTEEILAEMRANQDIQTRMMNASEGVNPKILQFLQQASKPPMTSTQQYIGPNQLLQGLESGQISLEQLLGRG